MRRISCLILFTWVAVIAAQASAWAVGTPTAPVAPAMMDCHSDGAGDTSRQPQQPDDCSLDPGCVARCTFVQPAIAGPSLAVRIVIRAVAPSWSVQLGIAQRDGGLPFRPPQIHRCLS